MVRIVSFEKNDGVIDRGAEGGIRVGEVFEVNRYDGDFVYWVGRVEVVVVKSRFAGVRLLAKAENASIQKGDVLELQKREFDPMIDKLKQSAAGGAGGGGLKPAPAKSLKSVELKDPMSSPGRTPSVLFGVMGGFLQPFINSSRLMGSSFNVEVRYPNGTQGTINMSEAYSASIALQAYFSVPLSQRLFLNLNYAYAPLNLDSDKEAELLRRGVKGSASLALVTATLNWRWRNNFQALGGTGLFLPQANLQSTRGGITISDRKLGFTLGAAHQFVFGPNLWLRSQLTYNVFLDQGPAVHFLALQFGPSFSIRK